MARHTVCPETMTVNNLSDWIQTNKTEVTNHIEKFPLTDDEINEYQRASSLASRQIDKLKDLQKYFTETVKTGTPWDSVAMINKPQSITVPPTVGLKVLEANRKFADRQLENGYKEEITPIYFIPWPEFEKMVAMDIEGEEWQKYSRRMTSDEIRQHGKPILSASQTLKDSLEKSGIEIDRVEDNVVHLVQKDKKNKKKSAIEKQPPLSEDEQREMDTREVEDEQGEDLNL